ncbi:lipopolysaccharide export system permease protein [Shimia gijangensis]|uniref:Lipopolysaccharide export system permease protein n=2 Tax=Shimia gijangensis TaxID=1470563 RepID=A0A1M6HD72_9RHOB|nr:lipopolysaccharide export system permease protein [Shimia gijangensis]
MLSQLLILFSFFALVLVSVYWVNRAVVLFDQLIANGQSAWVFLEFSTLSLPNVIRLVIPMSAFAASVYVTNRLSSESELTVMQATGFSPWRLARPVLLFGVIVTLMMSVLMHVLVPVSTEQLTSRQKEVTENITARLLTEGTFLHPTTGVTFYIREITPAGVLKDVFLSDRRNKAEVSTYSASESYLVNTDTGPKLVMVDGLSQVMLTSENRLFTTNFSDFTYDISGLIGKSETKKRRIEYIPTAELLRDAAEISQETGASMGAVMEEAHGRFNRPMMVISAALVGFATLLLGGYSRFGVWRQIVIAFVVLVLVEMSRSATIDPVLEDASKWPLIYAPTVLGLCLSAALLWLAAHPLHIRRRIAS